MYALDSMTKVGIKNKNGESLKAGDLLPIAYTEEEVNSIKEIIGMLYGYYNHEEKTSFQAGAYAKLFMEFKTYLVGEIKHYFALPNSKTSIGKIEHITDGIPTKEHPNGSPLYVYHDPVGDIDIYTTDSVDKEGNPLRPLYGWVAHPIEGLINSTLLCVRDLWTEEGRARLRANKQRRANAEAFLLRMLLANLLAALLALIFKPKNAGSEKELVDAANLSMHLAGMV